jgi:signal transduction histidine kinase
MQGLKWIPGLGQVQFRLEMLAFVAAVLSLAASIIRGDRGLIAASGTVWGINVVGAFLSGWKSEVLVAFILLFVFLYPAYKRTVTVVAPAVLIVLLAILPTYASVFRSLNWQGRVQAEEAAQVALDRVVSDRAALAKNNWHFLTDRISEIGMFTTYIEYVPGERPHYGLELVGHGLIGIVPRAVWPGKPNMEKLASQRVYAAGVVRRGVNVSAKPKFVVDAYLSWGAPAILLGFLLYGALASWASRLAERWFGGYVLGGGLVYMALFRVFWMSNTFEFFFNTVFWSFMVMGALFVGGRMTGFLVRESENEKVPA